MCDGVVTGPPADAGARFASVGWPAGLSTRVGGCVGSTCGGELAPPTRAGGRASSTRDGLASTRGARPVSTCVCDALGRSPAFELDGERVGVSTRGAAGRLSTCDGYVTGPRPGVDVAGGVVVRTGGAVNFVGGELGVGGVDDSGAAAGAAIGGELVGVKGTGASDGAAACASLPSSKGATTKRAAA